MSGFAAQHFDAPSPNLVDDDVFEARQGLLGQPDAAARSFPEILVERPETGL